MIESVLEPINGASPDSPELKRRIGQLRARLWDGPVVGAEVRRQLDRTLLSREFINRIASLPEGIQGTLTSALLGSPQLEAADRYLAA